MNADVIGRTIQEYSDEMPPNHSKHQDPFLIVRPFKPIVCLIRLSDIVGCFLFINLLRFQLPLLLILP